MADNANVTMADNADVFMAGSLNLIKGGDVNLFMVDDDVIASQSYAELLGHPYHYKPVCVHLRREPKVAFGFILDRKCRFRWARWYHELANGPDKLSNLSPEKFVDEFIHYERASRNVLPSLIYSEFPGLHPLHTRVLPVLDGRVVSEHYVFVLKDDVSWQGMMAPLDPEVIDKVRRRLGVGEQEPNWYRIDS